MKQEKTELMQMIETAKKEQRDSWDRISFKPFKKSLCDLIGASYDKIQLKEVANVREANQFIKFRELENAYILLVLKKQNHRMALIDIETKRRIEKLNYYCQDKVSVKKEIEDGATCYVIYCDDKQEKARIKELKANRTRNKKGSHLDNNSIYFRHPYSYKNNCDRCGFRNQIIKHHIKMAYRFMEHNVNYLIDKISEKECKLYNLYQNARNEEFRKTDKQVKLYRLHTPSAFHEELEQMRDAIIKLQNLDEKTEKYHENNPQLSLEECKQHLINYCKDDLKTNYIYIIEKEQTFKEGLRDFILINNKSENE
ncbi:hypothetical protein J6O86_02975 [bacterium]|nr:hypothetical protein [bacterium]